MSKTRTLTPSWLLDGERLTETKEIQFYRPVFKIELNGKLIGCVRQASKTYKRFEKKEWEYSPLRGQIVSGFESKDEALKALHASRHKND